MIKLKKIDANSILNALQISPEYCISSLVNDGLITNILFDEEITLNNVINIYRNQVNYNFMDIYPYETSTTTNQYSTYANNIFTSDFDQNATTLKDVHITINNDNKFMFITNENNFTDNIISTYINLIDKNLVFNTDPTPDEVYGSYEENSAQWEQEWTNEQWEEYGQYASNWFDKNESLKDDYIKGKIYINTINYNDIPELRNDFVEQDNEQQSIETTIYILKYKDNLYKYIYKETSEPGEPIV